MDDDIDDYELPNILFLRGCFLDDCNNIDDLFDQRLMNASVSGHEYYEIKDTEYDKIPNRFKSLETWTTRTNLKCWECDNMFPSIPIFIPNTIEPDGSMDSHGNFCSWGCATLHINLHYDSDERWEKHAMLRVLYKVFTGKSIVEIVPAPPKTEMVQFGGKKSVKSYREQLMFLNEAYETAIRHNSIDTLSPGPDNQDTGDSGLTKKEILGYVLDHEHDYMS